MIKCLRYYQTFKGVVSLYILTGHILTRLIDSRKRFQICINITAILHAKMLNSDRFDVGIKLRRSCFQ